MVLLWNGRQRDSLIHAEPTLTQDGHFVDKMILFRIIKEEHAPRSQKVEDIFTQEEVCGFHLSLSDNRLVKLNLVKINEVVEVKIIFESVHKKHQFAELLKLNSHNNANLEESKSESNTEHFSKTDLKVFNMTWNMGQKNLAAF